MPEVDLNTVPGLLDAIGNHGGLQNRIEIWDTSGFRYKITSVYLPASSDYINADDVPEDLICFDVEKVK
jgi:hypothetical protein